MTKSVKPLTQEQAAAIAGWSARRLRQIEAEDSTIKRAFDEKGNPQGYPPREFGIWFRNRVARYIGAADDGEIYDDKIERARLTHHQANNEALKEAINRRELIPASEVIAAWSEMVGAMRARLLALPGRLSNRVMAFDTVREAEDYAREEIYSALQELGDAGTSDP